MAGTSPAATINVAAICQRSFLLVVAYNKCSCNALVNGRETDNYKGCDVNSSVVAECGRNGDR